MDAFVTRAKRKASTADNHPVSRREEADDDDPTEVKLARLSSLYPSLAQDALLDILLAHEGSVSEAAASMRDSMSPTKKKSGAGATGHQTSLRSFAGPASGMDSSSDAGLTKKPKVLSRKGETLHLYDPADVSEHTPCTIIHNFLPPEQANDLLRELLEESKTFEKITFKLFDNVVSSPHTSSFFVSMDEIDRQKYEYLYNGSTLTDVRQITPHLLAVKSKVQEAVNAEIRERIRTRYPDGRKLKYQSPKPWQPNAAFVNCYDGPRQNVGWHSDQLTYLGPRAVIGSLSLGVAREFRVRRIVPRDSGADPAAGAVSSEDVADNDTTAAPNEGQVAIHLPHNSLLVMHAEMQEEWKHSVAAAVAIDPHPVAGNRRINVTYRDYRPEFHPRWTPRCRCGVATVLRVVQRRRENHGRYFWMCHAGNVPGKDGCSFFQWAEFDDDGNPIWKKNKSALTREEAKDETDTGQGTSEPQSEKTES